MSDEIQLGWLRVASTSASTPSEVCSGSWDLLVAGSGFDSRCECITGAATPAFDRVVLLTPHDTHGSGVDVSAMRNWCGSRTQKMDQLVTDDDVGESFSTLQSAIAEQHEACRRPLSVLVDLTGLSRFLSLGLLARGLGDGLLSRVDLFYSEGLYPEADEVDDRHELFTSGRWQCIPVPGLEGQFETAHKSFLYVSIGFEGSKTLRAVTRLDPNRISVLFPDPGVVSEYVGRTRIENEQLLRMYNVPEEQIVRAPAGDVVAALRAMSDRGVERLSHENATYLCCGTKPHSLALCLRAMGLGSPRVLYNKPDAYKSVTVRPAGTYWLYSVTDVTAK